MREGWSYKKLGEVCELYQPQTISTEQLVPDGQYSVYGANGIIGKYDKYNHEEKELLLTCRGATCGMINVSEPFSWINGNAMVVHAKDDSITFDYLMYVLKATDWSLVITGAAQPQITRKALSPLKISIAPLTTQQQIVSELDLLSHILDQKRQQLKEYDALAESIFYDMFGDPVENPKGWEVKKLGELSHLKNGLNFEKLDSGNLIKILGVSDFQNNRTVTPKGLTSIYLKIPVEEYLLKDNDLVFVRSNGSKSLIGRCVIMETDNEDIVFSGFCIRCRLTSNSIHPQFVSFVMQTKSVRDQITNAGQGCNISNVNQKILGSFLMIVPPLSLQRSFASKIESIEHQKQLLRASIKETEMLFQSRMDYWFNS